jgi:hypothetical protein
MVRKSLTFVALLAATSAQLACAVLSELGPPVTASEGFVPAGTTPHRLRITLNPDSATAEGRAASACVARCSAWSPSIAEQGRCVAACPSAVSTWDAHCRRAQVMCFDYVALRPKPNGSSRASGTAGEIASGTFAVVGMVTAAGLVGELCDRYSSDPDCNEDYPELGPPQ